MSGDLATSTQHYMSLLDALEDENHVAQPGTQTELTAAWRDLARTLLALAKQVRD